MVQILIVDDEDSLRELLARAIERKGIPVLQAKGGLEAIELYQKHKPQCVFLDIKMSDMDGMEVFKRMRQIDPQANIYFLSGSDNKEFKEIAKNLGASGYMVKPILLDDVMTIIKNLNE
jgi:CheY-like chemotaxis protein